MASWALALVDVPVVDRFVGERSCDINRVMKAFCGFCNGAIAEVAMFISNEPDIVVNGWTLSWPPMLSFPQTKLPHYDSLKRNRHFVTHALHINEGMVPLYAARSGTVPSSQTL